MNQESSQNKNRFIFLDNFYNNNDLQQNENNNINDLNSTDENNVESLKQTDYQNLSNSTEVQKLKTEIDVSSGINTDLENEVVNSKTNIELEIPSFDYSQNQFPQKRNIYRAVRNAPKKMPEWIINNDNTNEYKVNNIDSIPIPEVINIDLELENSSEQIVDLEMFDYEKSTNDTPVVKSDLLIQLKQQEQITGKKSLLAQYGDDFCSRDYITNPAIGRKDEIKQLLLTLLTPEKSAILVGKPGIGKTSIVEGLAYQIQRNNVPDVLKGYRIISMKTTSLIGTMSAGESKLQILIDELKTLDKVILFIDEVHMLINATDESGLDFANMFKESLGRGSIKMIGATTSDEYETYILRDKAFVRRFQRIDVSEPDRDHTIKILIGTLPKIEHNMNAKLKYSNYIQEEIMSFIVDITTEYKRIYAIGSRYPDICLTLLSQAFSHAIFDNRKEVNILDIRSAIENSKNIYPDVIKKELINFDEKFKTILEEEK